MIDLKSRKVAVLGFGVENLALVKFLVREGADVTVCDQNKENELLKEIKSLSIKMVLGEDYLEGLDSFEIVYRTPGLAYLNPKIQTAKNSGVIISSQTKLFFELCPAKIIGVTGTKGKGTTSTLIYQILKKSYKKGKVYLAGNIGSAPIEFIDDLTNEDIVVLEMSSFQLQDLEKSPHLSVVLNIACDHMDVHLNREEYVEAKTNIVRYQTKEDFAVINADYLTSFEFAAITPAQVYWFSRRKSVDQGVWVRNGEEFVLRTNNADQPICRTKEVILRGEHNWENISAAIAVAYLIGANIEDIGETVRNFPGLEHRLEYVNEFNNVKYYNDSFATTPETTMAAVNSFNEPIVLITGGSDKGADYLELGKVIAQSTVRVLISIGVTGPRIKKAALDAGFKGELIDNCQNIDEVMLMARQHAKSGDVVVLSPASASFDWFKNYKDRGNQFKERLK